MRRGCCIDCDHKAFEHEISIGTQPRGICLVQGCECRSLTSPSYGDLWAEIERLSAPIPMIIICPNRQCGMQHIDKPEPDICVCGHRDCDHYPNEDAECHECNCPTGFKVAWDNPPHRSHTCRKEDGGCGMVFRLADVLTTGVAEIKTRGKADTFSIDERKA